MKSFKLVMEGRMPGHLAQELGTAVLGVLAVHGAEVTNAGVALEGEEMALVGDMPRGGTAPAVPTDLDVVNAKLDRVLALLVPGATGEQASVPATVTPPKKKKGAPVPVTTAETPVVKPEESEAPPVPPNEPVGPVEDVGPEPAPETVAEG